MSYEVFMSIWGGFALLMAAGLLLAWIQRSVRKSRQTDPYEPGAAQALRDAGVLKLSVRQFGGIKGMEFARGEAEDLGSGTTDGASRTANPGDAGSPQGTPDGTDPGSSGPSSAHIHWLVLEGRGRSPLFDYEIHREAYSPEARQKLEKFAADFNRGS